MAKSLLYNESYHTLTDILTMCSLMFQKGIIDANGFCDPLEMRALANRDEEEHYTTLKLIIKGKIHTLDERQYLNVLRAYASEDKLYYFRNFTINGDAKIISALCTLMDFCYRIGVDRTTVYDRSRIDTMQKTVRIGGHTYLTPKGSIREQRWFDEVRRYITIIELEQGLNSVEFEKYNNMPLLDEFMAKVMKSQNELKTTQEIENERRKFILSGGNT